MVFNPQIIVWLVYPDDCPKIWVSTCRILRLRGSTPDWGVGICSTPRPPGASPCFTVSVRVTPAFFNGFSTWTNAGLSNKNGTFYRCFMLAKLVYNWVNLGLQCLELYSEKFINQLITKGTTSIPSNHIFSIHPITGPQESVNHSKSNTKPRWIVFCGSN